MEYKKAIVILIGLADKKELNPEEKEAITTAIGVMDCAILGESQLKSYINSKKAKRDQGMRL
ncbi:MAG: hypothetical protein MUD10_05380 [Candidatus Pacebacteria bacterium]|nr:hypothetical protein [Candidatus Paceibacterota bacterium]